MTSLRGPDALKQVVEQAMQYSTATLYESESRCVALPSSIKPVVHEMRVAGRVLTVHCPPYDNIWIHRALYHFHAPGSVLVVSVSGAYDSGYWGEILSIAAKVAGVRGLVIDGCVRDSEALSAIGFPVFARGLCIRGTNKAADAVGGVGRPISIGEVEVTSGDYIFGDADGVVLVPEQALDAAVEGAQHREDRELAVKQGLWRGQRTLDIYGLGEIPHS